MSTTSGFSNHTDEKQHPKGNQRQSMLALLQVPDPNEPWGIDAIFSGIRVKLSLPRDLAKLQTLPAAVRDTVRRRIEFRSRNIQVLRQAAMELDDFFLTNAFTHFAQHEQSLEQVVMALPAVQSQSTLPGITRHEPLLTVLPAYTQIDFFVPHQQLDQAARQLEAIGLGNRVRLHGEHQYELIENNIPLRHKTTYWMRDVMMSAADLKGNKPLLLPLAFYQINDLSRPDNHYVYKLATKKQPVLRVPLFFKGGNMMVITAGNRRILLIGEDELRLNQEFFYNAFFYFPPTVGVLDLFKLITGTDEVRILHNSKNLYHLDMVMSVVKPGTAAVLDPLDPRALSDDDRKVISQARQVLTDFGLDVVPIPTLASWVRSFKSPVNIIPYKHRERGGYNAIVPQFEDRFIKIKGKSISIHELIKTRYKDAGIETTFVPSQFYAMGGNVHCAALPIR